MTDDRTHETLVENQSGSRANAYLNSQVHAQGTDLVALVEHVHDRPNARVLDLGCGGGHVTSIVSHIDEGGRVRPTPKCWSSRRPRGSADCAMWRPSRAPSNICLSKMRPSISCSVATAPITGGILSAGCARRLACCETQWRGRLRGRRVTTGAPLLDTFFQTIEMLRDPSHVRDYGRAEWEAALAQAGLACETTRRFRVQLDFASWVERIATPAVQVEAIRALQKAVSSEVVSYFETAADGSFSIDVALFAARRLPSLRKMNPGHGYNRPTPS